MLKKRKKKLKGGNQHPGKERSICQPEEMIGGAFSSRCEIERKAKKGRRKKRFSHR